MNFIINFLILFKPTINVKIKLFPFNCDCSRKEIFEEIVFNDKKRNSLVTALRSMFLRLSVVLDLI